MPVQSEAQQKTQPHTVHTAPRLCAVPRAVWRVGATLERATGTAALREAGGAGMCLSVTFESYVDSLTHSHPPAGCDTTTRAWTNTHAACIVVVWTESAEA